jgi:hypothetical protein
MGFSLFLSQEYLMDDDEEEEASNEDDTTSLVGEEAVDSKDSNSLVAIAML